MLTVPLTVERCETGVRIVHQMGHFNDAEAQKFGPAPPYSANEKELRRLDFGMPNRQLAQESQLWLSE